MRALPIVILVLAVFLSPGAVRAEDEASDIPKVLEGISGAEILKMVEELASDEMQGRKTGFDSGGDAERYVAGKFVDFGLDPADRAGAYLEPFYFPAQHTEGPIAMKVAGETLTFGTDYVDLNYTGGGTVEAEVVFCGYGISAPEKGWDDYKDIDVKGKIVMAIRGAPGARAVDFHGQRYIGSKSSTAADHGAIGFILVQGDKASSGTIQAKFHRPNLPAVWASRAMADKVLGAKETCLADEKKSRDEGKPGTSFATGVTARLEIKSTFLPRATGNNALGMIKGRDEDLAQEVVLVGAHMDHLGVSPTGEVYNGADDNASGTAVMIHLVDILTKNGWRPQRTIVFCGFGAEEQGLHGSRSLVLSIPWNSRGIACMLNMDMVGQGEPKVNISGVGAYPEVHRVLEAGVPASMQDAISFSPRTGPGSDHWPFHELGVPAFFVGTKGKHPNYHTPKDDVANIKPEVLEAAAKAIGSLLVAIGEHREPLLDDRAFTRYITREGPRFAHASQVEDESGLLDRGVTCVVKDETATTLDVAKTLWATLAKDAEGQGVVLAKGTNDLQKAWRQGKLAWLPRLACGELLASDPEAVKALREIGFRWLAPFAEDGAANAQAEAIATAAKDAGVLVDLFGLDLDAAAGLEKAFGDHPAVRTTYLGKDDPGARSAKRPWYPVVVIGSGSRESFIAAWSMGGALFTSATDELGDAVLAWGGTRQNQAWWLGDAPERATIRQVLGGYLMDLLRRLP